MMDRAAVDRYVEEFRRWTVGSKRARDERAAELRAHLAEAHEAGDLDAALLRLGTPRDAARAFAEGVELRAAPLPRRAAAWITDYIVAAALAGIGASTVAVLGRGDVGLEPGMETFTPEQAVAAAIIMLPALLWYAVGNTLLEWRYGRTAGKALWRLRVASEDGTALSFGQAVVRRLPLVFSGALQLIDWVFVFFGGRNQRAFDRVAKTIVVVDAEQAARARVQLAGS